MIDNFYNINSLEKWLTKEEGLVYQNIHVFVSLNKTPSCFGHALVIPKRIVYRETDLTAQELVSFADAKEKGMQQLNYLVNKNIEHLFELYGNWANDKKLNKILPCKDKIIEVMDDLEQGIFDGSGNYAENIGEKAGQTIRQYHGQLFPRFPNSVKGCGEAFYRLLHTKE